MEALFTFQIANNNTVRVIYEGHVHTYIHIYYIPWIHKLVR
jgi:hypothetical protein